MRNDAPVWFIGGPTLYCGYVSEKKERVEALIAYFIEHSSGGTDSDDYTCTLVSLSDTSVAEVNIFNSLADKYLSRKG